MEPIWFSYTMLPKKTQNELTILTNLENSLNMGLKQLRGEGGAYQVK